jgi:beta-lactamase superfamily II metal-dependent hydrolase
VPIVKSFAVGNGDMFYIRHGSDNFTIIDCNLCDENADDIISELKAQSADKGITRFICTHPDEDHFGGIELLDDAMPIVNFYVVKNQAVKDEDTTSFKRYCQLRDGAKAFYISKGCTRRWMNLSGEGRDTSGINVLWPETSNQHFKDALAACDAGEHYNNTSAVLRYAFEGGSSFMWLGDLETDFMDNITSDISLQKTTVVFAAHHGRFSGKIPNDWLWDLDPQIIVIGEAPSRHLHYYTGYKTITQNTVGDITFDLEDDKVHIYTQYPFTADWLTNEYQTKFAGYRGSITTDKGYTR